MDHSPSFRLLTERLALRPTQPEDVARALEIRSNHEVARNLVSATIPPDPEKMTNWFRGHAEEWRNGSAYRLAITFEGRFIGVCDVFDIADDEGEIGYWLDRPMWGRGFGLEAAERLVGFAMKDVGLNALRAGCADDNPASAAILTRLGFSRLEDVRVFSMSRNEEITQRRFQLTRSN
ncbi:GNAT family N-acetyltransferase [Devosia sp. XGJD_8]|uniref:GNAT family N-acetyltransferase n=1 Tax=Devosia sp. XGJD_8 TaxID=3391187 RepID=UPI003985629B